MAIAFLFTVMLRPLTAAQPAKDGLMPVWREEGSIAEYRKIYEKKLFVTPGDVARYVFLPAMLGTEKSVSVFRRKTERNRAAQFQVTSTEVSENLWACVPITERLVPDWRAVKVTRRDAPIPESTALIIHRAWIARLEKIVPPPRGEIRLDSSSQIFSATNANGRLLRGETYNFGKKNRILIELGERLIDYCTRPPTGRAKAAAEIEKKAAELLKLSGD